MKQTSDWKLEYEKLKIELIEAMQKEKWILVNDWLVKLMPKFIEQLLAKQEAKHKKEMKEAIDAAWENGEMVGSMHHFGLAELRSNGYQERSELYKRFNLTSLEETK